MIGAAIVGGVIASLNSNENNNQTAAAPLPGSDIRLKQSIRWVETMSNGIRLHAFQYRGDHRIFIGVLAQEILGNPRYASAVVENENGFLTVDYDKLGLKVVGMEEMISASQIAYQNHH